MKFSPSLLRGTLIKRYKRFFDDVELEDGTIVTAHCPNTGAMSGCAEPGYTVFLSESTNPKRKLKYTWELAQTFDGHFIGINTHNANKLVAEALNNKVIEEFSDTGYIKLSCNCTNKIDIINNIITKILKEFKLDIAQVPFSVFDRRLEHFKYLKKINAKKFCLLEK